MTKNEQDELKNTLADALLIMTSNNLDNLSISVGFLGLKYKMKINIEKEE